MNNSYQFFHLETFADKPRKGSKRPSAEAVARECQRVEQSFPHISNMKPAELVCGINPVDALEKVRNLVRRCKDPLGRKIRSDAQIITFGVASVKVESTPENWELPEVKKWLADTEQFLKNRFGDSFVSLIKHTDEKFCHIHFCIIPQVNQGDVLDINSMHPGLAAQRSVKSGSKNIKDHAYKEAMRTIQDEYFEQVGIVNGQLRYGPRRRRLSRKEWHAQKRYAQLVSNIFNQKDDLIKSLNLKLEKAKNILAKVFPSKVSSPDTSKANSHEVSL